MKTTLILTTSMMTVMTMILMTDCTPVPDPCEPFGVEPPCCGGDSDDNEPDTVENEAVFYDVGRINLPLAERTVVRCPCDTSIVLANTDIWKAEEKEAVATAKRDGEGNVKFRLPVPDTLSSGYYDQMKTIPEHDQTTDDTIVRIAIIDSGLENDLLAAHRGEIDTTLNMFDFTQHVEDAVLHGSVVFTIIDEHADDRAIYYIYKAINDEGYATSFSIACALKCAEIENVDIINLSLGAYVDDQLLRYLIDTVFTHPAVITSQGNDCRLNNENPHYPSDYKKAFGISGLHKDYNAAPDDSGKVLWGCTNGYADSVNLIAPARIASGVPEEEPAFGTSFSAAYVTGKYAYYYFDHIGGSAREVFQSGFLEDDLAVSDTSNRYLAASESCVDVIVIK